MKLTNETIQVVNLFESISKAKIKDCFLNENKVVFVVNEGEMSKAIGKNGVHVKKIEGMINKKVKIVEFSDDVLRFIRNFLYPINVKEINMDEGRVSIKVDGVKNKGIIIGRDRKNIENLKNIVKKYFDVEDIRVI